MATYLSIYANERREVSWQGVGAIRSSKELNRKKRDGSGLSKLTSPQKLYTYPGTKAGRLGEREREREETDKEGACTIKCRSHALLYSRIIATHLADSTSSRFLYLSYLFLFISLYYISVKSSICVFLLLYSSLHYSLLFPLKTLSSRLIAL